MSFREFLKDNIVIMDGGMGSVLQSRGLTPGELPERWNLTRAEVIVDIQRAYFEAGTNLICANTFGANGLHYDDEELQAVIAAAFNNARTAMKLAETAGAKQAKFAALDMGPCGRLLKPYGDMDFEDCVSLFAKTVRAGVAAGADAIVIETMNDSYETKAAVLAAKENSDLPLIVTNAYGEDGKLMTGADPEAMVALLEGMGVDALGANCSLGPDKLAPVIRRILAKASVPVVMKANAGLPQMINDKTQYDITPDEFADLTAAMAREGVRVMGGCCGTTPEYIKLLRERAENLAPAPVTDKGLTVISSYTHSMEFGAAPILIGERINPTGKKRFRQALLEKDMTYILNEGLEQAARGAHVLDVNVGTPEVDERAMLTAAVTELQAVTDLPLQIDTGDAGAMEAALRRYNGKPLINSVSGKRASMDAIFPLAKKYGGAVICLTLDDNGIPEDARGRLDIARRIAAEAEKYGIPKKDLIFDTLTLTVSADAAQAGVTLESLRLIRDELGCCTSLGVSNVSFGLPERDVLNSAFLMAAFEAGLSGAIMNPYSAAMMNTYYAFKALRGMDPGFTEYMAHAAKLTAQRAQTLPGAAADAGANPGRAQTGTSVGENAGADSALRRAILRGLKEEAGRITEELLQSTEPLDIVNYEVIPALDQVGRGFEEKTVFLPQLLMAAEAAKEAFGKVKAAIQTAGVKNQSAQRPAVVVATVRGDIHDIGKNIAKLLLENYGFSVTDLGKDVLPETVAEAAEKVHARMVGLSALMTTTLPAMEETVALLKRRLPEVKVLVAGAVLNRAYAEKIGADFCAGDAMETVRFAESL